MNKLKKRVTFKRRRRNKMRNTRKLKRGGGWFSKLTDAVSDKILSQTTTEGIEKYLDSGKKLGLDKLTIFEMKLNDLLKRDIKDMNEINTKNTFGKLDSSKFLSKTIDISKNISRHFITFNNIYEKIFEILKDNNEYSNDDATKYIESYTKIITDVKQILLQNALKFYVMFLIINYSNLGKGTFEKKLGEPIDFEKISEMEKCMDYYKNMNKNSKIRKANFENNPGLVNEINEVSKILHNINDKTKEYNIKNYIDMINLPVSTNNVRDITLLGISDYFKISKSDLVRSSSEPFNKKVCRLYINIMYLIILLNSYLEIFKVDQGQVVHQGRVVSQFDSQDQVTAQGQFVSQGRVIPPVISPVISPVDSSVVSQVDSSVVSQDVPQGQVDSPDVPQGEVDSQVVYPDVPETINNSGGNARFKKIFKQKGGKIDNEQIKIFNKFIKKHNNPDNLDPSFDELKGEIINISNNKEVQRQEPNKAVSVEILRTGPAALQEGQIEGQGQGYTLDEIMNANSKQTSELIKEFERVINKLLSENKERQGQIEGQGQGQGQAQDNGTNIVNDSIPRDNATLKKLTSDSYMQSINYLKLTKAVIEKLQTEGEGEYTQEEIDTIKGKFESIIQTLLGMAENKKFIELPEQTISDLQKDNSSIAELLFSMLGIGITTAGIVAMGGKNKQKRRTKKHMKHKKGRKTNKRLRKRDR